MSGKRPSAWIRIWRSFKWPSHTRAATAAQALAQPPPIPPPLPVQATAVSEVADPGLRTAQTLASLFRSRSPNVEQALAELPPIAPPLAEEVEVDPAGEAVEATEVAASMQSSHATADFALPARLAIVAKLNVASARRPQYRPYPLPPGKAVPLASNAQPAYVRRTLYLEALKPTKRIVIQKKTALAPAVIVNLDAVRKAIQTNPIAKHAA